MYFKNNFINVLLFTLWFDLIQLNHSLTVDQKSMIFSNKIIDDNIFWSQSIESIVPKGFSEKYILKWISSLNESKFINAQRGCGRMRNQLLTTEKGQVCARFRTNLDQILGDYYTFLLARILEIENVPPTTLDFYEPQTSKWNQVLSHLNEAQWDSKPIVLTKYIGDLKPILIPKTFRTSPRRLYPLPKYFQTLNISQIKELVQWSDLIILDYLTANTDRIINNIINAHWNPQMMDNPTHNLLKQHNDFLIFLDNESGLFHGYRLLNKFEKLHRTLLDGVCIFRRRTIANIEKIASMESNQFIQILWIYFKQFASSSHNKNMFNYHLPHKNINILHNRMKQILKQVHLCRQKFTD